ncbi:THO complex subunit 7 [Tetrabaena socialis]|uniref:THO complex subunit 7 n=1 Tax=Tetrabaena socialis TaxID=47790 RepID=A0A2J8AIP5_9CHLO|nr:THO complex subunit 7 [Tetrabaena socialis]|eukprot:PNH12378.1 THO complex subunit 7 [Tetrabaena socialis]
MAALKLTVAEEEAIIKQRYLTQMTVPKGNLPLKVLTKKFLQLLELVDKGPDAEAEVARHYREFLREVAQNELHAKKLRAVCEANMREQDTYTQKQQELETAIEQTRREIEEKKQELQQAGVVLGQNQQYEVLRHHIMEHPSREVTQQAIDTELQQMAEARVEGLRIAQLMERRRKQFSLLFYVIEELQRTADSTEEPSAMEVDS